MRILERMYRSRLGEFMSFGARAIFSLAQPRMIYGYRDRRSRSFRKFTRISSTAVIMSPENLSIEDRVWIWHYSIIDATEGIEIQEGVQIGAWVGVFTHGSESSIRLLGRSFIDIPNSERAGYTRGCVRIGKYSFIGAGAMILPGVTLGKGCLVTAGAIVNGDAPDFSIVRGQPGKVVGSTLDLDKRHFKKNDFSGTYYDEDALQKILKKLGGGPSGAV
jgi:acetyltransferase-like isoleucine patch superfamily enzyme